MSMMSITKSTVLLWILFLPLVFFVSCSKSKETTPQHDEIATPKNVQKNVQRGKRGGISNIGNTCYFNTAFQQIVGNDTFRELLFKDDAADDEKTKAFKKSGRIVAERILHGETASEDEARNLFNALASIKLIEPIGQQGDSGEVLEKMLDIIKFDNYIQLKKTCWNNKGKLVRSQEDKDSLRIDATSSTATTRSLHALLKNGMDNEQIIGYKLPDKPEIMDVNRMTRLTQSPEVITVIINRNRFDSVTGKATKVLNPVEIDEELDLTDVSEDTIDPKPVYQLESLGCHSGADANGGHYTEVGFNSDTKLWEHISDRSVTEHDNFKKAYVDASCETGAAFAVYVLKK
ncbi:MAG: hypothetical protein HQK53_03285 [Oligoflexia bacterium]|nr:hypothetical protein [Oligoflexia bacterium]